MEQETIDTLSFGTMQDLARRATNLLKAGEVVRFHAVPTVTGQTVGHHSYGVAALLIAMGMMVEPDDRWVVSNAILHDAAELVTGDIPFTVKRANLKIKTLLEVMELQAENDLFLSQTRLSPRQSTILKLADMLEGLHWCLSGHERGNPIVATRWCKAIIELFLTSHHRFKHENECERIWSVFSWIADMVNTGYRINVPIYSSFKAQLEAHEQANKSK